MLYELSDEQVAWIKAVTCPRGEAPNPEVAEVADALSQPVNHPDLEGTAEYSKAQR
jgi:hypothetical protein